MNVDVNGSESTTTAPYGLELSGARARLYHAAVEAFAAKGFHGTTTRDIASRAGMSPAALYVHHRSKEEVLHLISSTGHAQTLAIVEGAIASTDDPVAALERLVVDFVEHHAVNHTVARVVNYELTSLSPEHLREVRSMRRSMDAQVRALVQSGVDAGAFTVGSVAMTAAAILSLGIDVARWFETDAGWTPRDLAEHHRALVLRMVGVPTR
ncbi:TetR/AcrR family transcriptional regulator [Nocardioides yefusunii]|uniref:TetR/AcrR family transcriptional regulator n=1 Tax=Nocardioides yefusunii TaxID=2500546 RepID=A0ABW1QYN8_9ACTN|nr:TetR/AcrR family transcriptional regulator [Nocardioides yefusunii]